MNMKLNLVVMTPGKTEGKAIPVKFPQFLIGRDPQCHLRPASPVISNRHCALLIRGDKVYIRDFESTNGTFLNEAQVKGQKELRDGDVLKIGPLLFRVQLEGGAPTPAAGPAQPGRTLAPPPSDDEAVAALLLSIQDDGPAPAATLDSQEVPTGSTVMDMPAMPPPDGERSGTTSGAKKDDPKSKSGKKEEVGDTAAAANSLLQKYLRRSRKT